MVDRTPWDITAAGADGEKAALAGRHDAPAYPAP
jgi:hypothetical protein